MKFEEEKFIKFGSGLNPIGRKVIYV